MFADFDFNVIARTWQALIFNGLWFTIKLTLLAMIGGVILGTLLAMARLSSYRWISFPATSYINLIRSIPLVLVIFWFYFMGPYVGAWLTGSPEPVKVGDFYSALITFTLFEAAYYCEIMRAGIQSVPRQQIDAAYALGMSYWQGMRHVILPQAFRNMLPLLLTQTIVLFQDVSLVYVIALPDFVGIASKIAHRDGRLMEMYIFVALIYFILCLGLSQIVRVLLLRLQSPLSR